MIDKNLNNKDDFNFLDNKNLKRFDKTKRALSKLFIKHNFDNKYNIKVEDIEGYGILNYNNAIMVYPKTYFGFILLREFYTENKEDYQKIPKLDYTNCKNKGCYSINKISLIINVLKVYNRGIEITTGDNYPVKIENQDFCFILAPRVDMSADDIYKLPK